MARAPHHLFGFADAADGWSVGRWLDAACEALADIAARGRTAIVVGGTGLYFNALTRGLAPMPQIPAEAIAAAEDLFDIQGEAALRVELQAVDPRAAARIGPRDRQRLVRALAVARGAGRPLSDWQADTRPALAPGSWSGVVLEPSRDNLYARCDARLAAMVDAGAIEEAAALSARALDSRLPAMKAVGLRELAACADGSITREAALEAAQAATRRYAKRQLTWFRNQQPDWPRIAESDGEGQWRRLVELHPRLTAPGARGI
jgi:tRNA dimethylallyltransferase